MAKSIQEIEIKDLVGQWRGHGRVLDIKEDATFEITGDGLPVRGRVVLGGLDDKKNTRVLNLTNFMSEAELYQLSGVNTIRIKGGEEIFTLSRIAAL